MKNIRFYTDIEQSKKLKEFLPIESADLYYQYAPNSEMLIINPKFGSPSIAQHLYNINCIPCWSIVALLNIINKNYYTTLNHDGIAWVVEVQHHDNLDDKYTTSFDDIAINACFKMVLMLPLKELI